jgi:hypothetical protein
MRVTQKFDPAFYLDCRADDDNVLMLSRDYGSLFLGRPRFGKRSIIAIILDCNCPRQMMALTVTVTKKVKEHYGQHINYKDKIHSWPLQIILEKRVMEGKGLFFFSFSVLNFCFICGNHVRKEKNRQAENGCFGSHLGL